MGSILILYPCDIVAANDSEDDFISLERKVGEISDRVAIGQSVHVLQLPGNKSTKQSYRLVVASHSAKVTLTPPNPNSYSTSDPYSFMAIPESRLLLALRSYLIRI